MKIYLAGPMSNLPQHNFPAFHAATADLRARGFEVISPAEMDRERGFDGKGKPPPGWTLGYCLSYDLLAIETCDGIVVLPGWEKSKGAKVEAYFAELHRKQRYLYLGPDKKLVEDLARLEAGWVSIA